MKNKEILLLSETGKTFLVKDPKKDFHCQFGKIDAKDLKKKGIIFSNTGHQFTVLEAFFIDKYDRMKRAPQIITKKDLGLIIAETGIGKSSVILDAGVGSGASTFMFANICKKVIGYEIRKDFLEVAEKNLNFLGLKNVTLKNKDIYQGIEEKNLDLINLDLSEPWLAIKAIKDSKDVLKIGSFIVCYTPTVPQVMDFISEIKQHKEFNILKTVELIAREWEVQDRKVRPKTSQLNHTGFLVFVRKIA